MGIPDPASNAEAIDMVMTGLRYMTATDPTALAGRAQAECLQTLEHTDAMSTAVRARYLAAFTVGQGYSDDADYSPTSWLIHRTRITKGAARGHLGWARRAVAHPTVLEALSAPMGAEDTRTQEQRYHDALEDAMRRLVASGLLPERAGQPVKVWAHVSLAELRALDDGSVLQEQWIGEMTVRWAAHRAAASETGSDGAAWLAGRSVGAVACDATIIPVVTGRIDPAALDDLVSLCLQFAGHGPHCGAAPGADPSAQPGQPAGPSGAAGQAGGPDPACEPGQPEAPSDGDEPRPTGPRPPPAQALEMLRHAIIGKAVDLVSGPGGLASFLRTRQLGGRLAGPSLPLDVGRSAEIPAAIRRAVILRDQHCRWAGGCDQPASACEVHHVTHLADGGTTSVDGCALYSFFHHDVAIHQWG